MGTTEYVDASIEELFEEGLAKTRKRVKKNRRDRGQSPVDNSLEIKTIVPKTANQRMAFKHFAEGKHLLLHGVSGTGKTFISLFLALSEIVNSRDPQFEKVIIVRSSVPSRDMGFLPGGTKDKSSVFETPYQGHCADLFGRADAYTILKNKKVIDFITTSYVRGTNITDSIVIIDEMQNMTDMELHSVITRLGRNTRLILCGDYRQDDLSGKKGEVSGLGNIYKILNSMPSVGSVEFDTDDVVRSGFVREYLIKRDQLGINPPRI